LLATPPPDALVSPSLPVRVFLQTKARPSSLSLQILCACHTACCASRAFIDCFGCLGRDGDAGICVALLLQPDPLMLLLFAALRPVERSGQTTARLHCSS
jgi:hypothetical protein